MRKSARQGPDVPRLWRGLLGLLLSREDRRFALADLEEEFEERAGRDGLAGARRWFRRQALASAWPALKGRVARWIPGRRHESSVPGNGDTGKGRGWGMTGIFQNIVSDLRFGLRTLRKTPLSVTVTVVSLGLGIGAVTATFAVADSFLWRPPVGIAEPDRLVVLYTSEEDGDPYGSSSFPTYLAISDDLEALDDAAAVAVRTISLGTGEDLEPVFGEEVTGNYFDVTGIRPALGRGFALDERNAAAPRLVAVLGHDLWRRRFGSDPGVVGSTVELNGLDFTVVGVAPDGVDSRRVPLETEIWVPTGSLEPSPERRDRALQDREARRFMVLGRLTGGATLEQLNAQAEVLAGRLAGEHPEAWTDDLDQPRTLTAAVSRSSLARPGARALLGSIGAFFLGTAGLILLIACSNVTSLFLARANRRSREMAVRASLGAGRSRLVSMLLAEALIPGLAAGAMGVLVAAWTVGYVNNVSLPVNVPIRLGIELDARVLAFAVATALGASLVFGLLPALEGSRPSLVPALKGEGGFRPRGRLNPRSVLVVLQCAASLVLLVGATLFVRALGTATDARLGVDPDRVAVATKTLAAGRYGPEDGLQYLRDLQARLAALPGVEDAELARSLELTVLLLNSQVDVRVRGEEIPTGGEGYFRNSVTPGYLDMLGIRVLQGRGFTEGDGPGAPLVAVINQTMANRFWPGQSALGQRIEVRNAGLSRMGGGAEYRSFEVVGVAADGKYGDFDDPPTPYFWTSLYQDYSPTVAVLAKGVESADAMIPLLRETIELDDGEVQLVAPSTYDAQLSLQFVHLRIASRVLTWGGGFGLFLAVIGIYGIVSFAVTQRTREMAVRMAMGAERRQVVGAVVRDGLKLALIGLLAGLLVALPAAWLLRSVLAGVSPLDPVSFGGGLVLLMAAALAASLVPARRATRIEPMSILRDG